MRITLTGVPYEADPWHHELLVRSLGLEAGTSVVTPGVKPAEPETSVVKGEDMQCVGPVMDSAGKMREPLTDQDGNTQLKNKDALDTYLVVNHSLSDIANDATLDDKHICALQRGAVKRVTLNNDIDYGITMAYSTTCGTLPPLVVATANGTMKAVLTLADHYTGKNAEVMRAHKNACAQTVLFPISAEH